MRSHISSVVSVSLALAATPALFTRISGSPNPDRTRAIIASTFGRWVTSHRIASPRRPAARMAETVSSSSSAERAATATSAPCPARASATARPIPRPPPVTSAIRPASSAMSGLAQDGCQLCGIDFPAGLGFNGVDPHRWLEGAERGRDPYREATATPRDEHAVKLGQILEQLEPDRAVAGHDPLIVERMDERPVDLRKAPVGERLPPA